MMRTPARPPSWVGTSLDSFHGSPPTPGRNTLKLVRFSFPQGTFMSGEESIHTHLSWVEIFIVYRPNPPRVLPAEAQVAFKMG